MRLPHNIILAGFMGTGKTSVGRALAARLGWKFADTDHLIEQRAGKTVTEIFEQDGEPAFRQMESETAVELLTWRHHVIATGGGLVVKPENRDALREAGDLILLTATPETIYERIRRATHRPLLKKPDPQGEIRRLLADRAEAYGSIEMQVATDERTVVEIVDEIVKLVKV